MPNGANLPSHSANVQFFIKHVSRENIHCPSCCSVFYEPDSKSLKKKKELRQQPNDSRSIKESDAAKTEVLSVIVEENSNTYSGGEQQGPRLGQSF